MKRVPAWLLAWLERWLDTAIGLYVLLALCVVVWQIATLF